ncbi:hypothetical protein [Spirosoma sp. KNUC1025]|uniref:hypothetical protein n=1 Tax=Spirosoma sp. KNUC1025 TaxID=2894082 RepID=UPI00386999F9|nr:hypothetical protein LN737_03875 [Spirosoma sp. KNUC1025]
MNYIQKFLFITLLLSSSIAFGQLTEDPEDRRNQGRDPLRTQTVDGEPLPFGQRLRFGGGITGFQFGNPFSLGVSPVIAYQATEHLIVGIGGNYVYTRYKPGYIYANQGVTINQYGGRGFLMYEFIPSILPNLYLHGELQTNMYQQKVDQVSTAFTGNVTAPLAGLTYMQPITRRFGVNLTALYNLNYRPNDPISYQVYGGSPFVLRLSFF